MLRFCTKVSLGTLETKEEFPLLDRRRQTSNRHYILNTQYSIIYSLEVVQHRILTSKDEVNIFRLLYHLVFVSEYLP